MELSVFTNANKQCSAGSSQAPAADDCRACRKTTHTTFVSARRAAQCNAESAAQGGFKWPPVGLRQRRKTAGLRLLWYSGAKGRHKEKAMALAPNLNPKPTQQIARVYTS